MFNTDFGYQSKPKLGVTDIVRAAEAAGVTPLSLAIMSNGYRASSSFWDDELEDITEDVDKYPLISLGNDSDIVGKYSRNVADAVKFPRSSAYMHFLGCVSAAMMDRFEVEYFGDYQPASLYIIVSQPPSTGKSAIYGKAIAPIISEVDLINERRQKERKSANANIARIKAELKNDKLPPSAKQEMLGDLEREMERLEKNCDIVFPISDPTPEGLAKINSRQGNFAVISDEATAVNSLLGLTYANSDRKNNSELVLKAWDKGHIAIARSNTENNLSFTAHGVMNVIAQDETINGIMAAGERGIGVSERFLLVREKNLLGTRKRRDENGNRIARNIDKSLTAEYFRLIHNIMQETNVQIKVSDEAEYLLDDAVDQIEAELGDGGAYSHSMLRGTMGKMDKQVIRIATVLHTVRNWCGESPTKEREISGDTMSEAIMIFHELSKTYISSANASGFAGEKAELRSLVDQVVIMGKANKGVVSLRSLCDRCRKVKPFTGQVGLQKRITDGLLPKLESMGYVCVQSGTVYVNPKLIG